MGRWGWLLLLLACESPAPMTGGDAGTDAGRDAGAADSEAWLEDVTGRSGVDFERPMERFGTYPERFSGGVCVLDVDGEPPMDLFFALQAWPEGASMLYTASEPLAFEESTARYGLDVVGGAVGCLAFDAEGDGDTDLLTTHVGGVRLFLREGARFVERSERIPVEEDGESIYASAAAGDVDGDGDLDLLVAGNLAYRPDELPEPCDDRCLGFVSIEDALPNLLLLRDDDGRYRRAPPLEVPDLLEPEPTLVVSITDLNDDGVPDLYVGNDIGHAFHNRPLIREADGVWRDRHLAIGLGHDAVGFGMDTMGFSTADLNGDGRRDHVGTSFEGDGSTVFLCRGPFCEPQRPEDSGTEALEDSFRWGAALVDLDLDGQPDLVEATGHVFTEPFEAEGGWDGPWRQVPNIMQNVGGGRFRAVATDGLAPGVYRGIAVTDLDADGRPDVVLAPAAGRPALLRNVRRPFGRPLWVELVGASGNRDAVGAVVTLRYEGAATASRERRAGEGYLGNFDPRLVFGVTGRASALSVEARWPDGETTRTTVASGATELRLVRAAP